MLKLHFKDNRHAPLWVLEKLYSIGSSAHNHLVLNEEGIDPLHARLIKDSSKFFLKDNNSSSGCFVNGQRITYKEIFPDDVIKLGHIEILVLDPGSVPEKSADSAKEAGTTAWQLVSDSQWLAHKQFTVMPGKRLVIGRGHQCDLIIPGTHLSRQHVEVNVEGNHLRIKDLASVNGTYLNDLRIDNATANNGDYLRLDVYTFRIVAPGITQTRGRKSPDNSNNSLPSFNVNKQLERIKSRPKFTDNNSVPISKAKRPFRWIAFTLMLLAAGSIAAFLLW